MPTERLAVPMPFVWMGARRMSESCGLLGKEIEPFQDPFPPVVEVGQPANPHPPRDSRFTRVGGETTDDT
jgi:hypothetical protein